MSHINVCFYDICTWYVDKLKKCNHYHNLKVTEQIENINWILNEKKKHQVFLDDVQFVIKFLFT